MWTKPYGMKEGFLIGGGLIIAGLMLELSSGPVDWDAFRWPINGIVLAGVLAFIAIIFLLRERVYGLQFIGTYKAAIPALVYAVVLTIIMGLTRQEVNGTWLNNMLSFWPFSNGRGEFMDQLHAVVLALRTDICVCCRHSRANHSPTDVAF